MTSGTVNTVDLAIEKLSLDEDAGVFPNEESKANVELEVTAGGMRVVVNVPTFLEAGVSAVRSVGPSSVKVAIGATFIHT